MFNDIILEYSHTDIIGNMDSIIENCFLNYKASTQLLEADEVDVKSVLKRFKDRFLELIQRIKDFFAKVFNEIRRLLSSSLDNMAISDLKRLTVVAPANMKRANVIFEWLSTAYDTLATVDVNMLENIVNSKNFHEHSRNFEVYVHPFSRYSGKDVPSIVIQIFGESIKQSGFDVHELKMLLFSCEKLKNKIDDISKKYIDIMLKVSQQRGSTLTFVEFTSRTQLLNVFFSRNTQLLFALTSALIRHTIDILKQLKQGGLPKEE